MRTDPPGGCRGKRSRRMGSWLISTLAWGPLICWVVWPLLDDRLAWHPAVGYSSMVALVLNWVYSGWLGVDHSKWPALVAILVAFNVSFSVAARSGALATFAAVSVLVGGLVSGTVSGLIVVLAVHVVRVRDYGALEDRILLTAPLIEAAMMIGITAGSIVSDAGSPLIGLLAGLGVGAILSVFVLSWVYGAVGIALSWIGKNSDATDRAW